MFTEIKKLFQLGKIDFARANRKSLDKWLDDTDFVKRRKAFFQPCDSTKAKSNGSRRMRELGHFWVTHSIVAGGHAIDPKPWQRTRFAAHTARQGMPEFTPENCWQHLTLSKQRASIPFQKSSLLGHTVNPTVHAQNPTETMATGRYPGWQVHDRHGQSTECVEST